jgi:hypothetical protein
MDPEVVSVRNYMSRYSGGYVEWKDFPNGVKHQLLGPWYALSGCLFMSFLCYWGGSSDLAGFMVVLGICEFIGLAGCARLTITLPFKPGRAIKDHPCEKAYGKW